METNDVIRRAHEAAAEATRRGGGLHADRWRDVRDGAALLRKTLGGRRPTPIEEWILHEGKKVEAWLGPSPIDLEETQ